MFFRPPLSELYHINPRWWVNPHTLELEKREKSIWNLLIARWMRTYLRVVAVQGTMQVAIIVVMARFATGF